MIGSSDPSTSVDPVSAQRNLADLIADVAWPLALLLIALIAWRIVHISPAIRFGIWQRLRGLKSMKAFGWEVAFLDHSQTTEVSKDLNDAISMFKRKVGDHYQIASRKQLLAESVQAAAEDLIGQLVTKGLVTADHGWRATVHARHAFLGEHYLQLCRYVGSSARKSDYGRAFPFRWGVVGLTFRLREPQGVASTSADATQLVREWGLTLEEANERADDRMYSYLTCPLASSGATVGVFFVEFRNDNPGELAFEDAASKDVARDVESYFETQAKGIEVTNKVVEIHTQVSGSEPALNPLDDL